MDAWGKRKAHSVEPEVARRVYFPNKGPLSKI